MKRIGLGMLGVLAVALVGLTTTDALRAANDAASIIKSRQTLMKGQSKHMKAINAILENGGDVSGIVQHAEALVTSARKIPTLFPEGTGMDDDVGRTGAKAAIWEDWGRFEAAARRLERESSKLVEVAGTGDGMAAAEQFKALGKQGCGGCHTPFRQKLD